MWNEIKNCRKILDNCSKFPQFRLATSVFWILFLMYGYLKWSINCCCDIRSITEFLLIVIVIPALAYAFGLYYYTCAVITVRPECFQAKDTLSIHADGETYSIKKKSPQIKIYFSRKGKHSVYLYDKDDMMGDGPQKANTYEHYIDYIEFKNNNKNESKDAGKENRQSDTSSIISNSSKQANNEKT